MYVHVSKLSYKHQQCRKQLMFYMLLQYQYPTGLHVNTIKTYCWLFTSQQANDSKPSVYVNGKRLDVVEQYKYLSFLFDSNLTFRNIKKTTNIIKFNLANFHYIRPFLTSQAAKTDLHTKIFFSYILFSHNLVLYKSKCVKTHYFSSVSSRFWRYSTFKLCYSEVQIQNKHQLSEQRGLCHSKTKNGVWAKGDVNQTLFIKNIKFGLKKITHIFLHNKYFICSHKYLIQCELIQSFADTMFTT